MAASRLFLLLGIAVFVVPACSRKRAADDGVDEPAPAESVEVEEPEDTTLLDEAVEQDRLRTEFEDVMVRRHLQSASQHRRAGQLELALSELERALQHRPDSRDAQSMRGQVLREMGMRAGETDTLARDQWESYRVRAEEQKVTVRRYLADGAEAVQAGQYEPARRAYENAVFIVATSRYAPTGGDTELADLGAQARRGLAEVDRVQAQAREVREQEDVAEALRRVAADEEAALLEARDRRARLLSMAVDHFNLEEFPEAQAFAEQVLADEPDNTVARDIVENARRARHVRVSVRHMRELKASFRRWQIDLEESKVPSSKVLQWPSQAFWDKITELRARDAVGSGALRKTAEERAVQQRLETRQVDLPFEDTPFPQAVDYLTAASGLNLVIDARAKEDLEGVSVTLQAGELTVQDALDLLMQQASPEGEVVYEVVGNVVRFLKREHRRRVNTLRIHPVADLTLGLTDFIPPQITQVGVDEDSETPLFGGQSEEAPQPYGTIEELMELVRGSVSPGTWEEQGQLNAQGKNLVVYAPPAVQEQVARFLDDLRAFAGIVITVETRFLSLTSAFLRDVGLDFRGLGGSNTGPLATLDDVTSGLDDNASAGFDNSGPGVDAGAAALSPSSGLFFGDGTDGDYRARTENIFTNPLGQLLTSLGGGTFQATFLDDVAVSALIRATEKSVEARELQAPSLTVYNTQRANISVINQIAFVQDFDVEVAQTSFIADPVIGVIQDGLVLDVRPTVSNDRQYITLELRPTFVDLATPIFTFQTLLGASVGNLARLTFFPVQNPVVIQLPELNIQKAETTLKIPDGGSVLLGGLKEMRIEDRQATTPVLGNIPLLRFLFSRDGKSDEVEHLMIVVSATITDVGDDAARLRG